MENIGNPETRTKVEFKNTKKKLGLGENAELQKDFNSITAGNRKGIQNGGGE